MSTRVHSNIGLPFGRQLGQPFTGKAIGTVNPNLLRNSNPSALDAMGKVNKSGLFTFAHDGASQAFTFFYWSNMVNQQNPAQGWVQLGANSAEYTKSTVDPYSAATVTAPEDALIFIMAGTTPCNNCWMGGASKYSASGVNDIRP